MNNVFVDSKAFQKFDAPCFCGSGRAAGECCLAAQNCPCGSGRMASECCYAPLYHEDEDEDYDE